MLPFLVVLFACGTALGAETVQVVGDEQLLATVAGIDERVAGTVFIEAEGKTHRFLVEFARGNAALGLRVVDSGTPTARTECRLRVEARGESAWDLSTNDACDAPPEHHGEVEVAGEAPEAAPGDEQTVLVCLSDGQRLRGTDIRSGSDVIALRLADAYVTIPNGTRVAACADGPQSALGRPENLRVFTLPGDQRIYGKPSDDRPPDDLVILLLLNHDPITVPEHLVLSVTTPPADDPVVLSARRGQRTIRLWIAVSAIAAAGLTAGLIYGISNYEFPAIPIY